MESQHRKVRVALLSVISNITLVILKLAVGLLIGSVSILSEAIHGFHDLRTRKAGGFRFVEFHIKVDPLMTVQDSHDISEKITVRIKEKFPHTSLTIHTEPCDGNCEEKCLEGCMLPVKGDINSKRE